MTLEDWIASWRRLGVTLTSARRAIGKGFEDLPVDLWSLRPGVHAQQRSRADRPPQGPQSRQQSTRWQQLGAVVSVLPRQRTPAAARGEWWGKQQLRRRPRVDPRAVCGSQGFTGKEATREVTQPSSETGQEQPFAVLPQLALKRTLAGPGRVPGVSHPRIPFAIVHRAVRAHAGSVQGVGVDNRRSTRE